MIAAVQFSALNVLSAIALVGSSVFVLWAARNRTSADDQERAIVALDALTSAQEKEIEGLKNQNGIQAEQIENLRREGEFLRTIVTQADAIGKMRLVVDAIAEKVGVAV